VSQATELTPTAFISHGSPAFALADLPVTRFWESLPQVLSPLPQALLCVSAHWDTGAPTLAGIAAPRRIQHDYYGFPPPLYTLTWPDTAGSGQAVAEAVRETLAAAGLAVALEDQRPLDHGVWIPLRRAWPSPPVPVLQLSLCTHRGADWHWQLGEALAPLRKQGIWLLGSGGPVHNLARLEWARVDAPPPLWASEFMAALEPALLARDRAVLCRPWALPNGREAVPTAEHYLPLLVALAAAGNGIEILHESWTHGSLACHAYAFH